MAESATDIYDEFLNLTEIDAGSIYTRIIQALEKQVQEPLYPGDERRLFGEGIVAVFVSLYNTMNDVARQTFLRYARGQVLDAIGERSGTARLPAEHARTRLRFALSTPRGTNILIPKWTKVTADNDIYFATDAPAVLQAGSYSVEVAASAIGAGGAYNGYRPASITQLVDLIPYIESVTNLTETAGGDDGEPYTSAGDDRFRERIRLAASKLSTAGPEAAYRYWTLTADAAIVDAAIVSEKTTLRRTLPVYGGYAFKGGAQLRQETLRVFAQAGEGEASVTEGVRAAEATEATEATEGVKATETIEATEGVDFSFEYADDLLTIFLLPAGALADAETVDIEIQETMAGRVRVLPLLEGGKLPGAAVLEKVRQTLNADTVRPLTDDVIVEAPTPVFYDIELKYYTTDAAEAAVIETIEGSDGAIERYNRWQTEALGRDINPDQLRRRILAPDWAEPLAGALRVDLVQPVYTPVDATQVAQWSGFLTVTHEVVRGW